MILFFYFHQTNGRFLPWVASSGWLLRCGLALALQPEMKTNETQQQSENLLVKYFLFSDCRMIWSYYWKFSTDVTATQFFRKIYIWKINTSQNNYRQPSDCGMVTGWSQFKPSPYSVGHSHTNFTIFNVNGKAKGLARIGKGRLHNHVP